MKTKTKKKKQLPSYQLTNICITKYNSEKKYINKAKTSIILFSEFFLQFSHLSPSLIYFSVGEVKGGRGRGRKGKGDAGGEEAICKWGDEEDSKREGRKVRKKRGRGRKRWVKERMKEKCIMEMKRKRRKEDMCKEIKEKDKGRRKKGVTKREGEKKNG